MSNQAKRPNGDATGRGRGLSRSGPPPTALAEISTNYAATARGCPARQRCPTSQGSDRSHSTCPPCPGAPAASDERERPPLMGDVGGAQHQAEEPRSPTHDVCLDLRANDVACEALPTDPSCPLEPSALRGEEPRTVASRKRSRSLDHAEPDALQYRPDSAPSTDDRLAALRLANVDEQPQPQPLAGHADEVRAHEAGQPRAALTALAQSTLAPSAVAVLQCLVCVPRFWESVQQAAPAEEVLHALKLGVAQPCERLRQLPTGSAIDFYYALLDLLQEEAPALVSAFRAEVVCGATVLAPCVTAVLPLNGKDCHKFDVLVQHTFKLVTRTKCGPQCPGQFVVRKTPTVLVLKVSAPAAGAPRKLTFQKTLRLPGDSNGAHKYSLCGLVRRRDQGTAYSSVVFPSTATEAFACASGQPPTPNPWKRGLVLENCDDVELLFYRRG